MIQLRFDTAPERSRDLARAAALLATVRTILARHAKGHPTLTYLTRSMRDDHLCLNRLQGGIR